MKNVMSQRIMQEVKNFWEDEEGMGTIEVVLILVVLIGLVMIFKEQIGTVLTNIMSTISTNAGTITADPKP